MLLLVAVAFIVTPTLIPARGGAIGVDPQVCDAVTPVPEVHGNTHAGEGLCGSRRLGRRLSDCETREGGLTQSQMPVNPQSDRAFPGGVRARRP